MFKKIFPIILGVLIFSSGCSFYLQPEKDPETIPEEEIVETEKQIVTDKEEAATDREESSKKKTCRIIYLEIGIDPESKHFEHRVANLYSINTDGTGKKLIYSDINSKYGLARVHNISPDGNKILCSFFEGGRGAYNSLSMVDVETGEVENLVTFDYTEREFPENIEEVYGNPIWSPDSNKVAYEIIYNPVGSPMSGNYRTDWIHIYDIQKGESEQIIPKIGGMCASKITFMQPVIYLPEGDLYAVFHPYNEVVKDGEIVEYYSKNETLYLLNETDRELVEILDIKQFEGNQVETVTSFSNFNLMGEDIVFEVLGDFEEDGDLYLYSKDKDKTEKLTNNDGLREQQPDVWKDKICYVGAQRYGTVGYQKPSGDLFLINLGQTSKLTDHGIGVSGPVFSLDGNYIAYNFYNYDQNYEYIENTDIYTYRLEDRKEIKIVDGEGSIISLVGWIETEK